jgi:hypothetical protein
LFDDVPNDLDNSLSSVIQILLVSGLRIAIKHLDIVATELQLGQERKVLVLSSVAVRCWFWMRSNSHQFFAAWSNRTRIRRYRGRLELSLIEADYLWTVVF